MILPLFALAVATAHAIPVPPRAGVVAPLLAPLARADSAALLATPQHCTLQRGDDLLLVASESGRQAIVRLRSGAVTLRYDGRNPVRNGGRFVAVPGSFDLWIAVRPDEDRSLASGLPRHVTVMINGADGGSDAYAASYSCSY